MIFVYVLQGEDGKRYVGITNNLERRLMEHRSHHTKGGQLLGNFTLVLTEEYPDYTSARKREMFLKSGPRMSQTATTVFLIVDISYNPKTYSEYHINLEIVRSSHI
ncbi:MAG TPA: GIY-YIG nuclease family protein [Candidatus Hydrogenedentes bacterium]|nr:GIY-YIG nuclease family protein [Candidatus Hydrogenedentota bacterium]